MYKEIEPDHLIPNYEEWRGFSLTKNEVDNLLAILLKEPLSDHQEAVITCSNASGIGTNYYLHINGKKFDITDYHSW